MFIILKKNLIKYFFYNDFIKYLKMDIFTDPNDNSNNYNNNIYKQILSNQISYNFKEKDSILVSEERLNENLNNNDNESNEINHKTEALRGNIIPSIVLLNENKVNINDTFNNEGDTLLHLACQFPDLNVIQTLIEKFQADYNLKNKNNKTPFDMLCNNKNCDHEIISYFLKKNDLIFNNMDNHGINPLILSIKNKNNNLFYALCSMGCDLNHKDKEFHDLYYYALKYDNLLALKYLLKYSNIDLFSSNNNLTPILVTSEGSNCCKYLFKYHYNKVINGIAEPLNKDNYQHYELNLFNYELIYTCFNQTRTNVAFNFFNIVLPNKKYYYKIYNIKFLILNLIIKKLFKEDILRKIGIFYYCGIIFLYTYFYIDLRQFYFNFLDIISLFTSVITVVFSYNLFVRYLPEKIHHFYEPSFNYACDKKCDSILGICENAYKNNVLDLPGTGEDCPRCLIKKNRNIQHCNKCDACVKDYYFHSNLLGICISNDNVFHYSLLNILFGIKQLFFISLIYNILIGSPKFNRCFTFYKFFFVLIESNVLIKLFSIILFFNGFICIGIGLSTLLCIGYNVSYYLTYRENKIPYGRVIQRKINGKYIDYLAPIINMVHVPQFFQNLYNRKELEFI